MPSSNGEQIREENKSEHIQEPEEKKIETIPGLASPQSDQSYSPSKETNDKKKYTFLTELIFFTNYALLL